MQSSTVANIFRSVRELGEPVRVHGAPPSARAWLVSRWIREQHSEPRKPLIVVCVDDTAAEEFATDLETLSTLADALPLEISVFPSWEQSLYSPIVPSIRSRLGRARALSAITRETPPHVVITSLVASCQSTIPKEIFSSSTISIRVNQSVQSREALIQRLLDSGYLRVDPVEDPGTFAVRGDIVDVFPVDRDRALRIELFGDEVERIREFDAATQRTFTEPEAGLERARITPAREVLVTQETYGPIRESLKTQADDIGIPRTIRDPVLASIYPGIYPDHVDAWVPFAYSTTSTFWDYAFKEWPIVWNDEMGCLQEWDRFLEEQKKLFSETAQAGPIVPAVEKLYPWSSALESEIRRRSRLYLDRIELADLSTMEAEPGAGVDADLSLSGARAGTEPSPEPPVKAIHHVVIRPNTDLARDPRQTLLDLESKLGLWKKQGFKVLVVASTESQAERIRFLFDEHGFVSQIGAPPKESAISIGIGDLSSGFRWPAEGMVILSESEILGTRHRRKQRRSTESGSAAKDWSGLQALSDLAVGDAVVHIDHGVGRYLGLVRLDLTGAPTDFLQIEYASKDKLYLPVYRLDVIQKYVGAGAPVTLDRLGSQSFARSKEKVRDAVKKLAIDLVRLYAERKLRKGYQFGPRDADFAEFEAKFAFDETPDQLRAIEDTLRDMESGRIMDRLVCGDVGYGKTEVAIRAAYRAVSEGKQVAVLVPTTILAHQHELSFRARMKDYPITIESLSRFKNPKQQKETVAALAQGKVDIVIGTHRLLSSDIKFHDLGLIVVDEEHRFGVEHKERLKALKVNTHVLTLTATPIPRTLHMALSGLRDISLMNTPPVDRLPIRTYVSRFDDSLVQRAIDTELSRGGQVFFLHNRVQTIFETANRIRELAPAARIGVAHGQMRERELEKAMDTFYNREVNVLVCSAIIESGIDLPSANTIIINRADTFGLAQLYQIRGRVGRGQNRAYAYLLIPAEGAVTEDAKRRLEVIQRFVELGSGFSVASHDLEIRGGGDLLGPQQSGHISAVGFDLYTELLEEAIHELEGQPLEEESQREPEIKTPFPAFLAENYVPNVHQRLSLYRRLSAAKGEDDLHAIEEELRDRFGPPPAEAQNLFWLIRIKQKLRSTGIDTLVAGPERISLLPGKSSKLNPVRAIALISGHPQDYQLLPDSKFVAKIPTHSLRDLYFGLERLVEKLA